MEDAIRGFAKQLNFEPEIENKGNLGNYQKFIIGGMGGSHLAADILKNLLPKVPIIIHKDYGLPELESYENTLFIGSSFSGNTEEVISFAEEALSKNLPLAAVSKGGELLRLTKERKLPLVKIPETDIQPRMALGYSLAALAALLNREELLVELRTLPAKLNVLSWQNKGLALAQKIKGKIPIIYASERNRAVAYNWKIKFNENSKIPAFFNVFPELNHNEMTGFDTNTLGNGVFNFIFIRDNEDHNRIQKRMEITAKMYKDRNLEVTEIEMEGESRLQRIFNSLILADWTSFYTAEIYGHEPEKVPMVEDFKKLISD